MYINLLLFLWRNNMQMGLGVIGSPGVIFKRKFRWTLEIFVPGCNIYIAPNFCKVASRPKIGLDPVEINFLHATTWIPGKAKWESLSVTYLDVNSGSASDILDWLATLYNFQDSVGLNMSEKNGYDGVANLVLYDGCGIPLEIWQLQNIFPESIDFGDLDYESNEICTIEMSLKFTNLQYSNLCDGTTPQGCCTGCL